MEVSEITYIILFGSIIMFLLIGFLVYVWFMFYKRNMRYNDSMKTIQLKFKHELLQTQIEIQEQTLKNVSQEIHDNIGQILSLAKLNLNTMPTDTPYSIKLIDTKNLVGKAINDLRNLSRSLYGDKVAELGLLESIEYELKILQNTGQYKTKLSIQGEIFEIETQKEMVIFRIVQEALNNIVHHAKASTIDINIAYTKTKFTVSITDNGIGMDINTLEKSRAGIGLKSMQNRAALIGAIFTVKSSPQKGCSIIIETNKI